MMMMVNIRKEAADIQTSQHVYIKSHSRVCIPGISGLSIVLIPFQSLGYHSLCGGDQSRSCNGPLQTQPCKMSEGGAHAQTLVICPPVDESEESAGDELTRHVTWWKTYSNDSSDTFHSIQLTRDVHRKLPGTCSKSGLSVNTTWDHHCSEVTTETDVIKYTRDLFTV